MSELVALTPKEAMELGAQSLIDYGKIFFPRTFRQESPPFHKKMGEALYSSARFNAFAVFRGGAKTSLLRVYTSQRVAYGLSRTIMMVSVSQNHSKFSVRWLRRQVMYNKKWADTFGLRPGKKWTDEWCEIECHLMEDKEMPGMPVIITVLAMGITGQIRGFNPDDFRPDLIIADDILDDENSATDEQRKKIESLFFGALLNSLAPTSEVPLAKAVLLQTPMDKKDLLEKCMNDPEWNPTRFGVLDEKGESRWPQRWSTEELKKSKEAHVRRSQYRLWMREMECQIVSGEEKAIDASKFRTFDVLPEQLDKIISIDPASSDSPKADKFVQLAVGFRGLDVFVIAGAAAQKNDPGKAVNDFFNLVLLVRPRKAAVESVAFQRVYKWILEQEMQKRKLYVMVEELKIGKTSNADRIMQTIPAALAFGHIHVHPSLSELLTEADDYDPAVKDAADDWLTALANAIIAGNPALLQLMDEEGSNDGVYDPLDERSYKPIRVRCAP